MTIDFDFRFDTERNNDFAPYAVILFELSETDFRQEFILRPAPS